MPGYINGAGITNFIAAASGNIQSGMLGADAVVFSGNIGSGQIITWHVASGTFTGFELGSGAIVSGRIASGQVGNFHIASGQVQGLAGAGVPNLASGTVNRHNLGSGAVNSGHVASGQLDRNHFASGSVIDYVACEAAISGIIAVVWGSGGCFVVPAERASGLRLPAIGVVAGNFVSGDIVPVVRAGLAHIAASGAIASGARGLLYVGSGGLIVNQSGFMGGASSGQGAQPIAENSGSLVQRIGMAVSGGIDVRLDTFLSSGLFSGGLGQW